VGIHLGVNPHTVSISVKGLYRHFDVNNGGESLARFVSHHAGRANGSSSK
jgi:hypothetical protein